jgi:hypothetical protein
LRDSGRAFGVGQRFAPGIPSSSKISHSTQAASACSTMLSTWYGRGSAPNVWYSSHQLVCVSG